MKKSPLLAGVLAALSVGTFAYADDDNCYVPMSKWQSREAVRNMVEAQGWNLRRIKIDDGCYEIKGHDPSGREFEAKINPSTLAVIEIEYGGRERKYDDEGDDENGRRGNGNNASPPENGLFAPDANPWVIVQ